ncbi:hypothetical protein BD310DRAFT_934764 [Dichomitus squalens]|uniref:DUF6533 domain-containing protein n=1 Tax=Dichomitus squalens TaxID=114155 RepID=A0A4Q9PLA0_9APHY|nr:hypothetical protein BD310DRAFT_934764 [Dichomitus squalens]
MASSQISQFVAEYSTFVAQNDCFIAGAVIFLYDAILTTGEEVRCFWGRKLTGAAILFWLNKYLTILYLVWNLGTLLSISDEVGIVTLPCKLSVQGSSAVLYALFLIVAAFAAIRVYALRKSIPLCSITFVLAMVPFGVNFAQFGFGLTGGNMPPFGCSAIGHEPEGLDKKLTIVSRSCLIAADCLAASVTWFALARPRSIHTLGVRQGSLAGVLLIDGLHTDSLLRLQFDIIALQATSEIANFTIPLTAVLVSRFLLHLQSASMRAMDATSSSRMQSTNVNHSLVFEHAIGSLGASISVDDYLVQEGNLSMSEDDNVDGHEIAEPIGPPGE